MPIHRQATWRIFISTTKQSIHTTQVSKKETALLGFEHRIPGCGTGSGCGCIVRLPVESSFLPHNKAFVRPKYSTKSGFNLTYLYTLLSIPKRGAFTGVSKRNPLGRCKTHRCGCCYQAWARIPHRALLPHRNTHGAAVRLVRCFESAAVSQAI